ncbi:hypothetical protein LL912_10080 [Niabella sp. CC-SYL272]|uniref:hypothetical protein n=1 Tax=Niabella agricola TaxID=2891571 RepID=UPI001F15778D|nr:hypothetical protein [Niabella agricola]MCF3109125.1 hypothetical protein [Niabella agricola]
METKNYNGHIYKPLMAGLFAGYIATVFNLVYDVLFREQTAFPLHDLINVSTIIFATLFALPLAGVAFAFIDRYFRNGTPIYVSLSAVFTLLCVYGVLQVHRSPDPVVTTEFHELLLGLTIISGIFATVAVPWLVKHQDIYM